MVLVAAVADYALADWLTVVAEVTASTLYTPQPWNDSFGAGYSESACAQGNAICSPSSCVQSTFELDNLALCSVSGSPLLMVNTSVDALSPPAKTLYAWLLLQYVFRI